MRGHQVTYLVELGGLDPPPLQPTALGHGAGVYERQRAESGFAVNFF